MLDPATKNRLAPKDARLSAISFPRPPDAPVIKAFLPLKTDFIFYQSGVDVLATDKLGRLGLTKEGCKNRDRFVLSLAKENDLPIVCSMGGGYSERIIDIVEAHANTYRLAQEIFF